MFMPNDGRYGGEPPMQPGGQPFDLQARLAQLPPQIRAQVMARMGMQDPGDGGMQAGLPDQGMNQVGPMPPQGGMRPGLPSQGAQGGPIMDPRQGPPGPPQPMPAPGSGPIAAGNPFGKSQAGPVMGQLNERGLAAQQGIYGGFDPGRQGQMGPVSPPQMQPPKGPEMVMGQAPVPAPGNVMTPMPAPVGRPIGNARGPQMNATDRAAAIAADKAMVGGAPPYVGKPKPMPQTDPPVAGTATDVKPLVGKPAPAPTPQQDPLQATTKPKPKPKPTLGRNYGPK